MNRGAAAYAIAVRSSEFDLPPEMVEDIVASMFSRPSINSSGESRPRRIHQSDEGDEDDN